MHEAVEMETLRSSSSPLFIFQDVKSQPEDVKHTNKWISGSCVAEIQNSPFKSHMTKLIVSVVVNDIEYIIQYMATCMWTNKPFN